MLAQRSNRRARVASEWACRSRRALFIGAPRARILAEECTQSGCAAAHEFPNNEMDAVDEARSGKDALGSMLLYLLREGNRRWRRPVKMLWRERRRHCIHRRGSR